MSGRKEEETVKTAIISVIIASMAMLGSFAHALEPFVLYDDFGSKIIDETRWYGEYGIATGVSILEDIREIKSGRLHVLSRYYGNMGSDSGTSRGFSRLGFANPNTITAMKATVQVMSEEADGCPNNSFATTVRAALQGTFFNTGTPTPNSSVNDVLAGIGIELTSNSSNAPNILNVLGYVIRCNDSSCVSYSLLRGENMGTIKLKAKTDLSVQWDQPNHQFIVQVGKLPPVSLPYAVSDTHPPGVNVKELRLTNYIANCTTEPRLVGFVDAYFDNVFVNQSAAP